MHRIARTAGRVAWRLLPFLLCGAGACGEREAPPPPAAEPALVPAPGDTATLPADTLQGDSVMARDTLWPQGS